MVIDYKGWLDVYKCEIICKYDTNVYDTKLIPFFPNFQAKFPANCSGNVLIHNVGNPLSVK